MIKDQTNTNNFDRDIIVRFLEGYATNQEESDLSAWVNSSEENKKEFLEIKEIWNMAVISEEMKSLDVEADWKTVSSKISKKTTAGTTSQPEAKAKNTSKHSNKKKQPVTPSPKKPEAKIKKMNFTKWITGIAAGLALLAASYFVLQNVEASSDYNGHARHMVLADGTNVWLNKDGKLNAPKQFTGKDRIVYLTGEAFFDVAHDAKKPFRIIGIDSEIKVLGTAFNVRTNERITDVVVEEGKVQLINESKESSQSIILNPGEVGMSNVLGTTKLPNNRPNYHSWRTGKFNFENVPLKFAIRDLNGWFDKEIVLSGQFDCNVTGSFNKNNQKDILNSLKGPCNFELLEFPNDPQHKNKIYLKKVK